MLKIHQTFPVLFWPKTKCSFARILGVFTNHGRSEQYHLLKNFEFFSNAYFYFDSKIIWNKSWKNMCFHTWIISIVNKPECKHIVHLIVIAIRTNANKLANYLVDPVDLLARATEV